MRREKIESFRQNLRSFERLIEHQTKNSTDCNGVSLAQCHAILALDQLKSSSVNKLADDLGLDKSTVSRTIEGLVRIGLVNREIDMENRRASILTLTGQGKKTVQNINEENNLFFRNVFLNLPQEKLDSFIDGFNIFVQALKYYLNEDKKENDK